MAYKLKEKYKDLKFDNMNYALKDLEQKQIASLPEKFRNKFFTQDKPIAKKSAKIKREIQE